MVSEALGPEDWTAVGLNSGILATSALLPAWGLMGPQSATPGDRRAQEGACMLVGDSPCSRNHIPGFNYAFGLGWLEALATVESL